MRAMSTSVSLPPRTRTRTHAHARKRKRRLTCKHGWAQLSEEINERVLSLVAGLLHVKPNALSHSQRHDLAHLISTPLLAAQSPPKIAPQPIKSTDGGGLFGGIRGFGDSSELKAGEALAASRITMGRARPTDRRERIRTLVGSGLQRWLLNRCSKR